MIDQDHNQENGASPDGDDTIRSKPQPHCAVCGSAGRPFLSSLHDPFYGAPGRWDSRKCHNDECGLVWLDPMPLEDDLHLAYRHYFTHETDGDRRRELGEAEGGGGFARSVYDLARQMYLARRYGYERPKRSSLQSRLSARIALLNPAWRAAFDSDALFLEARNGGRLLEVGCGSGRQLKIMQDRGWRVEGIDLDRTALENARARGLEVSYGSLHDQGYPASSFDAIVVNHVIEHVPDPAGLAREAVRVLKTGGRLVVVTPNIESYGMGLFKHGDVMFMDTPRHLYVFTPGSMRLLADAAGFTRTRVSTSMKQAAQLYLSDRAIARTGHFAIGEAPSLGDRLGAKSMQLREWLRIRRNPDAGEEIVLLAEKTTGGREASDAR